MKRGIFLRSEDAAVTVDTDCIYRVFSWSRHLTTILPRRNFSCRGTLNRSMRRQLTH